MSVFRSYDIRGIYPDQLNGELAYRIGMAFGKFLGKGSVAVAMDARLSGPDLKKNLIEGMRLSGLDVMDIGMAPTPVLYFTVASMGLDGGAMITGSHNPKEYNGIKLCKKNGLCLSYETGIGEIERLAEKEPNPGESKGALERKDMLEEYADFVAKRMNFGKRLKVVIDPGNGAGGLVAPKIFRKLGCEVVEINGKPDGNFPNHHPDPIVRENLVQLQGKVRETGADAGIAYDGDADRVGFVDEKGDVVPDNNAFALIIENVLRENPGGKIIYEVLSSKLVEDVIEACGGVPVLSRVGHSYIQMKMMEGAVMGGETSGHYYFRDNYSYDDGIFGSLRLAELLSNSGKGLSELSRGLPKYFTSDDTRIFCPDDKKFKVVEKLAEKFRGSGEVVEIDGVKVLMDNSWFIVRASNTQPALVLRWEAGNEKEFKRLGKFVKKKVDSEIKSIS